MNILPYKLTTTNDNLTSRAGLITIAHTMQRLGFAQTIDNAFPLPKSNRAIAASSYLQTFILMQHQGDFHLDDVRHLHDDTALIDVLGMKKLPKPSAMGGWLRTMGKDKIGINALTQINKQVLQVALHKCKAVTLDIDASEIISRKAGTQWTYKKNQGYMPMVGHIAEVGQVVACDFREGNASPAKENLEFILQCENALPDGVRVKRLRIDAAGFQVKIIQHCENNGIEYAIRAKNSTAVKEEIATLNEEDWTPLIHKNGDSSHSQDTYRCPYWMTNHNTALTLVIQRKSVEGQVSLELEDAGSEEEVVQQGYIYRAIVTNRENLTDSEVIHWYNQRAEDSENRIKELKLDFGADTLPCSDFNANALYFMICALSFNLFALMRLFLPEDLAHHRVITLRWRLYAIAAKVVKTGRQLYIKMKAKHCALLESVLSRIRMIETA